MKTSNALQRGKACLSCRKRKMRCDGQRPICGQCVKGNRDSECQYHDKKQISRTEMLRAKVAKLEARLRELEVEHSGSSSSPTPAPMSPSSPSPSTTMSSPSEELILLQPPGITLPSSSSASIDFDSWDDDDRFALGAGSSDPSSSQNSSLRSTPWLSDFLDVPSFLNDSFFPSGEFSPGLLSREPRLESPNHWEDGDAMCQNKQKLLDIFFAHRHQCAFDVHIERFRASMSLPPAQQPHPALLDAMYLMACYFSQMPATQEGYYLQRALTGISSSLQDSDRLIQIVQASCLIAIYFFSRGRTLEGYYHSSTAARLAVSLGLHQIKSEEWYRLQFDAASSIAQPAFLTFKSSLQLPTPKDSIEYTERVAAFWQVFQVDRAWSVASGLPAALPDDDNSPRARVETTWPAAIGDTQDVLECIQPPNFMANAKLNPCLRAKATMLFERSYRLASKTTDSDDLFWTQHNNLDCELIQFGANMPQLASSVYQDQLSRNDLELVSVHTLMHTSTINLHRDLLVLPTSYHRCVGAANAITGMIKELNEGDYSFLNPIISTCWRSAAHVYLAVLELQQQQSRLTQSLLTTVNTELDALMSAMRLLGRVFPVAAHDAQRTESERAMRLSVLFVPS